MNMRSNKTVILPSRSLTILPMAPEQSFCEEESNTSCIGDDIAPDNSSKIAPVENPAVNWC
ncbi:uncharacterized protein N7500_002907 [Penicillium coprophilum]|uniref:uncharacterized protein n=1 Tax=Penicillium coprophilum TaxID=36646 RepID=UPI00239BC971|nr:uncharacterized protein N7500_002907 [Penicillium coprophilum]KAJ5170124.1 hypothetical protein N7500_002907 [Penicillium coprophilum]